MLRNCIFFGRSLLLRNKLPKQTKLNWFINAATQTFDLQKPPFARNIQKMVKLVEEVTYLEIPDKSENDKKEYKVIVLSNGLKALLVSDPSPVPIDSSSSSSSDSSAEDVESCSSSTEEADSESDADSEEGDEKLAACAVLVDVGSFSEPTKYQGLAHFLEHMIFMGSEKYPNENDFDAHIKKCGGFDNANTDCEETLFYFEVADEHLDSSMDYFTALFKAPLMKKESMQREREAVESEFQQTLHDDEARRDQLLAFLATAGYPHNTFTWGNLQSLQKGIADEELHGVLHEFRKRHYSAHRMIVCVQARLPIEELEQLVVKHFAGISNNNLPPVDFAEFNYRLAFTADFHEQVYFLKPVENVCKVELTWVLPPMRQLYKCKPDQFMAYLIGYEGEGSLCAYLRKRLWALDLIAGIGESGFDTNSIYALFNLCIYLTDEGYKHLDDVLAITFAYVKLFSQAESLLESYSELQSIEATSFRFQPERAAYDSVQNLVLQTRNYPPKDILTGQELYFEYDAQQIKEVLDILNEFKFNIMITSQQKYEGITYDKKEKWFGTEYTTMTMPQKWRELWDKSEPIIGLHLPKRNQFIAKNFQIFCTEPCTSAELFPSPKCLLKTDTGELWFRQDDKFRLPETHIYFYFVSPLLRQTPKMDVLGALYAHLIKFALAEELYPASVAGLNYEVFSSERGLVMKVSGYNEKIHLVVDIITNKMISLKENINENALDVYKKQQKKIYFNALIKPNALNKDIRLSVVENIHWPMIEKYKCLNDITLKDMLDFADTFSNELFVQALIQGNYTEESAHNVMNSVLTTLNCQKIKEERFVENRIVQIPLGVRNICCHALNDDDVNTVVTNYYQIGPGSVRLEAILDLLMMFVEEPLFDQLRTKEQLGYSVSATVRINYGITGYSITVNSQESKVSADHVDSRIEDFRSKMLEILADTKQDDFEHVRESLIKTKQVVDMSLGEEMARNWGEITCQEYIFDRRRKEVEVLRTLTKADLLTYILNNEALNKRKLSVQVIGNAQKPFVIPKESVADKADSESDSDEHSDSNEDSDHATNSDIIEDDEVDEELFNSLANKLDLVFLERDSNINIVDIDAFKRDLFVFPVTKTKLEEPKANQPPTTDEVPEPVQIIEDC